MGRLFRGGGQDFVEAWVSHRVREIVSTSGPESSLFIQRDEVDRELFVLGFVRSDASDRLLASFRRVHALSHEFDNEKGSTISHHIFTDAGGASGSDFVVHIQTAANDR